MKRKENKSCQPSSFPSLPPLYFFVRCMLPGRAKLFAGINLTEKKGYGRKHLGKYRQRQRDTINVPPTCREGVKEVEKQMMGGWLPLSPAQVFLNLVHDGTKDGIEVGVLGLWKRALLVPSRHSFFILVFPLFHKMYVSCRGCAFIATSRAGSTRAGETPQSPQETSASGYS